MNKYKILPDILCAYRNICDRGITFIQNQADEVFISYQSFYQKVLLRLHALQSKGIKPGDEIILQIDNLADFITSFWAGLLGGFIPVPLAVPAPTADEHFRNLLEIYKHLENPFILTDTDVLPKIRQFVDSDKYKNQGNNDSKDIGQKIEDQTLFINQLINQDQFGQILERKPTDIAFIQYSSGSTGKPKGVVLTHENILSNIYAIIAGIKGDASDISLSWMPLTHDMGLIGFHLVPLVGRAHQFLMPVSLFARRPLLWLEKASEHKATVLGSPDFGLKLFLAAFKPGKNYDWDLSSIRLIFNGAEPINETISTTFTRELKKYKLKENAIFPVYGLAEATLAVTFPKLNERLKTVTVNRDHLFVGKRVEPVAEHLKSNNIVRLVDVGFPVKDCRVKIVDSQGNDAAENTLGHILIKGKNVTNSYNEKFLQGGLNQWVSESVGQWVTGPVDQKVRGVEGEKVRNSKRRLKASKPCETANSNELFNNPHFDAFAAGTVHLKKPSGGPKGLIGPPRRGDGWLNTGDLGFLREGRLVITGREKDMIIVNGRNFYLHDLERLAEQVEGINPRKSTICGIYNPDTHEEDIYLFLVYKKPVEGLIPLWQRLSEYIYQQVGITIKYVIPVSRIPITTSGKPMRHVLVQKNQEGEFSEIITALEKCKGEKKSEKKNMTKTGTVTETEAQLLTIVARLLNLVDHDIDVHDNLSEYGVDSLKLPMLLTEVEKKFPNTIQLIDCFDHPTIHELAGLIDERKDSKTSTFVFPEIASQNHQHHHNHDNDRDSVQFNLGSDALGVLAEISKKENVPVNVILLSLAINLFKQVYKKNTIRLHTFPGKGVWVPFHLDLSGIVYFSDLLGLVNKSLQEEKENRESSVKAFDIDKTSVPVFYKQAVNETVDERVKNHDLVIIVKDDPENHSFIFDFNIQRFPKAKIQHLAHLYIQLIQKLVPHGMGDR
ncbi:MAG: non-ribosomal peptide synthetase [Candidatus Aminicenantes bacterium]|jgi:acyl-CoA synthetase (AMP-forming)/AMP-acid ligase II/acyl carrier protein